jgi:hypothetical protein
VANPESICLALGKLGPAGGKVVDVNRPAVQDCGFRNPASPDRSQLGDCNRPLVGPDTEASSVRPIQAS